MAQVTKVMSLVQPYAILKWAGRNVSQELSKYVQSMSYTDSLDSEQSATDELTLSLVNNDGRFFDAWKPSEGETLEAGIGWVDASSGERHQWIFGLFIIDGLSFGLGPDKVAIKASAKTKHRGKIDNVVSRTFKDTKLSGVTSAIASDMGVPVVFGEFEDCKVPALQQRGESTDAFLKRLVDNTLTPINIKDNRLIVGNIKQPELVLDARNRDVVISGTLPESSKSTFSGITVQGYDPIKQEVFEYTAGDPNPNGKVQKLYNIDNINSIEDAKRYASSYLNTSGGKSKQKARGQLMVVNTCARAGQIVTLQNLGKVHPRWRIERITTSISKQRWTASLEVSRA